MKLTIPTTNHKIKQKCVGTTNLSEDNWCKPLLSFVTKTTNITEISNIFFTVPSLISSPKSRLEPTRERAPCSFSSCFLLCYFHPLHFVLHLEVLLFFWIPTGKTNNFIVMKQYMVTGKETRSYKTDDGEPMTARWALVRVRSSMFPCALAVPSSWYRFIHLSREERVSP